MKSIGKGNMQGYKKTELPSVLERHELKYTIPYSYVEPITRFLLIYCDYDYYSTLSDDRFYQVNSLYFDTRCHEFLKQRLFGKNGRFNMRVRCYGRGNIAPYYLKIKHKHGITGVKYRAKAGEHEWPAILTDPDYRVQATESVQERRNKELFSRIACSYSIEPKILTQYRRRAFVSNVDEYARVTMDVDMRYRLQSHYGLVSDEYMTNYDNETIYSNGCNREASVILELKCNIGQVPAWMLDLIALFELKQQGFSKYASSSLVALVDNGICYSQGDRIVPDY